MISLVVYILTCQLSRFFALFSLEPACLFVEDLTLPFRQ